MRNEVVRLEQQLAERDQELQQTLNQAQTQSASLQEKLDKAEQILRSNQASVGVRVENMEADLAEARGIAEDNQNAIAAVKSNIREMRGDTDARINQIEQQIETTINIPEGKQALFNEAEKFLNQKNYKQSRRLFRTYLSRYPNDKKNAEVRFKIGLTLFSERDYRSALGEFYWITQNARGTSTMPDALYYSGLAFAKLGQCKDAIVYFKYVSRKDVKAPKRYREQAKQQVKTLEKDQGTICQDRRKGEKGPGKRS